MRVGAITAVLLLTGVGVLSVHPAASATTRLARLKQCTTGQMAMVSPAHGGPNTSTTQGSEVWFVQLAYRNRGQRCLLEFPRTVELGSSTGGSAISAISAVPSYTARAGARVFVTIGMAWYPRRRSRYHCEVAVREVTSATVIAGDVRLSFPVKPAFAGVCSSKVWLQVSRSDLI